MKRKAILIAEV